ncbi:hypothetical protein KIN20_028884 [Parelaphostrongylus tenuis]|uniref:Uncharacterized protein n=1 Tax=Parelaphostrongylus tenuis TaxID=148309 RepID=A0AAD5R278_PARTN|nr:hypothetical protein KIN20_028884 [Parelaphostrongylus tenuis]
METVIVVLESQGRSALLPEEVISAILRQLTVNVIYEPLLCQKVFLSITAGNRNIDGNLKENCIIAGGNTVTGICRINGRMNMCEPAMTNYSCHSPTALVNFRNYLDHKHHHGELVETDVAKCSEQSGSNVDIGFV